MIAVCWVRLEFQIKQAIPWLELRRGPTTAEKSLLLNYVTKPAHECLYKSAKMSHWSVTLAVAGTLILQLTTITSTSLLSLEYREMSLPATLVAIDAFDFMKNNRTPDMTAGPMFWAIEKFNTSYPTGATPQYATQLFTPMDPGTKSPSPKDGHMD